MKRIWCVIMAGILLIMSGCGKRAEQPEINNTLGSAVAAEGVYQISCSLSIINNHVGDTWEKSFACNGRSIHSGDTFTAPQDSVVIITGTVTENDHIPDMGMDSVRLPLNGEVKSTYIYVRENRGVICRQSCGVGAEMVCGAYWGEIGSFTISK